MPIMFTSTMKVMSSLLVLISKYKPTNLRSFTLWSVVFAGHFFVCHAVFMISLGYSIEVTPQQLPSGILNWQTLFSIIEVFVLQCYMTIIEKRQVEFKMQILSIKGTQTEQNEEVFLKVNDGTLFQRLLGMTRNQVTENAMVINKEGKRSTKKRVLNVNQKMDTQTKKQPT